MRKWSIQNCCDALNWICGIDKHMIIKLFSMFEFILCKMHREMPNKGWQHYQGMLRLPQANERSIYKVLIKSSFSPPFPWGL